MNYRFCQACGWKLPADKRTKYQRLGFCNWSCHRKARAGVPRNTPSELLAEPENAADEAEKIKEIYRRAEEIRLAREPETDLEE